MATYRTENRSFFLRYLAFSMLLSVHLITLPCVALFWCLFSWDPLPRDLSKVAHIRSHELTVQVLCYSHSESVAQQFPAKKYRNVGHSHHSVATMKLFHLWDAQIHWPLATAVLYINCSWEPFWTQGNGVTVLEYPHWSLLLLCYNTTESIFVSQKLMQRWDFWILSLDSLLICYVPSEITPGLHVPGLH